jgi:para-nitrobenzyl esterase
MALIMTVVLAAGCGGGDGTPAHEGLPQPTDPAVVQTATGALRGVVAADHRLFAGIPYAAPPVGPLRWQPPAPVQPWQGARDATRFGPRCMQDPSGDLEFGRQTDEDCLTLNVWTPPAGGGKRPVMVWIHGGAFINGSGGIYDARWFADREDTVVVTLNYRLGALGFLAHPALGAPGDVGNYGLADQQAALRWVRDNIANFGGDPDKVTVAGESAGGMSVCDHLVAPDSAGLFRAAIIQSGPCQAQVALPVAEKNSLDYAAELGCGDPQSAAQCLRGLPANRLRAPVYYYRVGEDSLSGPVTGTKALPVDPITAIGDGRAARVPVMIGTNRDEFTLFVALQYLRGHEYTAAQYPQLLADTFGRDERVYAYEFNDPGAPAPDPLRTVAFPVGASHSLELRYLFDVGGAPPLDPAQQKLSEQMIDYWSKFVATGEPGTGWPALGPGGKRLSFQPDGSKVITDFDEAHQCPFWAGLKG